MATSAEEKVKELSAYLLGLSKRTPHKWLKDEIMAIVERDESHSEAEILANQLYDEGVPMWEINAIIEQRYGIRDYYEVIE